MVFQRSHLDGIGHLGETNPAATDQPPVSDPGSTAAPEAASLPAAAGGRMTALVTRTGAFLSDPKNLLTIAFVAALVYVAAKQAAKKKRKKRRK